MAIGNRQWTAARQFEGRLLADDRAVLAQFRERATIALRGLPPVYRHAVLLMDIRQCSTLEASRWSPAASMLEDTAGAATPTTDQHRPATAANLSDVDWLVKEGLPGFGSDRKRFIPAQDAHKLVGR